MRADPLIEGLDLGDHLCIPVSDVGDRIGIAAALTGAALRHGDRAIVLTDDPAGRGTPGCG